MGESVRAYDWPKGVHRADRPRFALVRPDDDVVWAVCAEVAGLFADPPRETYTLHGCTPQGPLLDALGKDPRDLQGAQEPRPLGDLWICPVPCGTCPADSGRHDAWRLADARLIARHPRPGRPAEPGGPGPFDLTVDATADEWETLGDRCLVAGARLHDGRDHLGRCTGLTDLGQPQQEADPLLELLGCAPTGELLAALAAKDRNRPRLGEALLKILDVSGIEATERYIATDITDRRPSALGPGLIDVALPGCLWDPPPLVARAVWQQWFHGPPAERNLWAPYSTRARQAWVSCALERGFTRYAPDAPPESVYHLDGRHITDEPGFYCAIGEAVNGPGGYFGRCPDALADCLCGGFGATVPCTLIWHDSAVARHHLARLLDPDGEPYSYFDMIVELLTKNGVRVILR